MIVYRTHFPFFLVSVSEGSDAGGEDHERPGLEQRQRGGFQRVRRAGGRAHRRLQRLLPGAEEENQVDRLYIFNQLNHLY